jgi:hypothetical protein
MNILKSNDLKNIDNLKIIFKDLRKTSNTKNTFKYDIYNFSKDIKEPFVFQTPTLTTTSNILFRNGHHSIFLGLKNLEYEKEIQNFYVFLTKVEYLIYQKLIKLYDLSETFDSKNKNLFDRNENDFSLFISTEQCITISTNIKMDLTNVYNRFKKQYTTDEIFNEPSVLKKNTRCIFILELPSIWFELNSENKIEKFGLNYTALQIKILEQCAISQCLIEEDINEAPCCLCKKTMGPFYTAQAAIQVAKGAPPPPPPPPPPGFFKLGGLSLVKLKKNENVDADKSPIFKPKNTNGFKPPTLDDILKKLKSLKKTEMEKEGNSSD